MVKISISNRRMYYIVLGALIAAFIFMRIIMIRGDYLYKVINHETSYMACLAKDFSSGLVMSPWDYIYLSRQQGHLIASLFAAPFYYMLGDSHYTLRLAPLVWSLITLIVWLWCILKVYDDKRAAAVFAFLYIFLPPGSLRFTLELCGHFPQMEILFPLTIAALFLCIRSEPGGRGRALLPFVALGGLCGFGIYLHPYFIVMDAVAVCYLLLLRPRFFTGRECIVFVTAFLAAFSPKIYYHLFHVYLGPPEPLVGSRYNLIPSDILNPSQIMAGLKRCRDMFFIGVPLAENYWNDFRPGFQARVLPWAHWGVCVCCYFYLLVTARSGVVRLPQLPTTIRRAELYRRTVPLAPPLFFVLFLAFTGISRMKPMQHFQMLAFATYFILITALAISRMIEGGRTWRTVAWGALAVVLVSSVAGEWKFLTSDRTGLGRYQRGTYYPVLAWKLKYKIFNLGLDADENISLVLAKKDPFDRRVLTVTLGDLPWSCLVCPEVGSFNDILIRARTIRSSFRDYFWRGLGRVWVYSGRPLGELGKLSGASLGRHELSEAFRGAGAMSVFVREPFIVDYREKIKLPEPHAHIKNPADMKRFQGWRPATLAEDVARVKSIIESLMTSIPEEYRADFAHGALDYLSWKHGGVSEECIRSLMPPDMEYIPAPYFFPPMLECYL